MQLDLRLPIGLMFLIIGLLLTIYGLVSPESLYERSLKININLYWGLCMAAFGAFMLLLSWRRKKPNA